MTFTPSKADNFPSLSRSNLLKLIPVALYPLHGDCS